MCAQKLTIWPAYSSTWHRNKNEEKTKDKNRFAQKTWYRKSPWRQSRMKKWNYGGGVGFETHVPWWVLETHLFLGSKVKGQDRNFYVGFRRCNIAVAAARVLCNLCWVFPDAFPHHTSNASVTGVSLSLPHSRLLLDFPNIGFLYSCECRLLVVTGNLLIHHTQPPYQHQQHIHPHHRCQRNHYHQLFQVACLLAKSLKAVCQF